MFQYTMWMLVHLNHLVLSSVTLSGDILWFILIKKLVICVPTTLAKQNFIPQQQDQKVMGDKHNVLVHFLNVCAPKSSGIVLCNPVR